MSHFTHSHFRRDRLFSMSISLFKSSIVFAWHPSELEHTTEEPPSMKILRVTLDKSLTFKPHVTEKLKKTYAKIAALRRLKRMVPVDILIKLYNAYVLPHLEYCSPILINN